LIKICVREECAVLNYESEFLWRQYHPFGVQYLLIQRDSVCINRGLSIQASELQKKSNQWKERHCARLGNVVLCRTGCLSDSELKKRNGQGGAGLILAEYVLLRDPSCQLTLGNKNQYKNFSHEWGICVTENARCLDSQDFAWGHLA
jgi:hypothetical protein